MSTASPTVTEFPKPLTDAEKAEVYRAELKPLLDQICALFDRARKDGLVVNFNISPDAYGRSQPTGVSVVKPL